MAKATVADISAAILEELPDDGSTIGNARLRKLIAARLGVEPTEADYLAARDALVQRGLVAIGRGRGGSLRRVLDTTGGFSLEMQHAGEGVMPLATPLSTKTRTPARSRATGDRRAGRDEGAAT